MERFLKQIDENTVPLIQSIIIKWILTNEYIFPSQDYSCDLEKRKKELFFDLDKKFKKLNEIKTENPILLKEIQMAQNRINFFKEIYDIEAHKLNNDRTYKKMPDYNFYSKKFFGIDFEDIEKIDYLPQKNEHINKAISKQNMLKLLKLTKDFIPDLKIDFGKYPNFVVSIKRWILIPEKDVYNLQELITLFFHEMSHYVRWLNMKQNVWFVKQLFDFNELEEGLALYNEYYYWNQVVNYGKYYPFYHKIYNYLFLDLSYEQKQQKVYEILSYKWFSLEKANNFFQRFYRFAPLWGKQMLLKDAIYYNSYKKVNELLEDWYDLDLLMSIKWGLFSIENLVNKKQLNNFNHKKYFETMVKEIRKLA